MKHIMKLVVILFVASTASQTYAVTSNSNSDCLFNWAESNYPSLFVPHGTQSASFGPYYLRYYSQTNAYLGVSSENSHLYYLGPLSGQSILDLGAVSTWHSTAGCNVSDLQLAKNMFSELRTTLNSFANDDKTGFLNTQAQTINADLDANAAPEINRVVDRLGALGRVVGVFEDAQSYSSSNSHGLVLGTNPSTSGSTLLRRYGDLNAVWYGYASTDYDFCWTDSPTGVTSKVTCAHAASDSADRRGNRIHAVVYELTAGNVAGQYNYTATRYNIPVSTGSNGVSYGSLVLAKNALLSTSTTSVYLPVGSGTFSKTVVNDQITQLNLSGTLPPSAFTCVVPTATSLLAYSSNCPADQIVIPASDVDNVAFSATRTALAPADNYHYELSGSVSTASASDPSKTTTLSFDNGSYIDAEENSVTKENRIVAVVLIGTIQTAATKFTGRLTLSSFMNNADQKGYAPTNVVFDGSISDTPTGSASQLTFLTGNLEASVADYDKYYPNGIPSSGAAAGATNYAKATVTFTGTIQAPSRPLLKLVLSAAQTGRKTGTTTFNYGYDNITITGSGTFNTEQNSTAVMTLVNQDGIQLVLNHAGGKNSGIVSKSDATLATISQDIINYVDGYSESFF